MTDARELQTAILNASYSRRNYLDEFEVEDATWYAFQDEEVTALHLDGFGRLEVVEIVGGYEGSGEHMHIVFKLTHPDYADLGVPAPEFFKIDGYYSSYGGSEWEDSELYSVTPQQKTITVYE